MAQPNQPTSIILAIRGLFTNPSTYGDNAPNGALSIANNVVIDRPSVVATRRGFNNAFSTLVDAGTLSLFQYANTKLLHATDDKMYVDLADNGVFTAYTGSYEVPDSNNPASRIRGLETNKNFYFITSNGTYRIDSPSNNPRLAGSPAGLSGTGTTTGSTGFMPDQTNIAYRVVFGYRDANQQLVLGAPSSRIVFSNTSGGTRNTSITFQQPKEIQASATNFFFQVYRGHASPNLTTEPDDEMFLVYEDACTNAASVTITDITPDSLVGAALYTNQGVDGILQSNYRPPWAADVCTFKQFAFYANTRNVQNASITLISAGALNGADALVPGDTITFTATELGGPSFVLTANATNDAATGKFAVSNTGNPGLDIQVTASNIALIGNAYASNTFLSSYYVSNANELPGKLRFDRLTLVIDGFTITSSRATCWEQALPITSSNESRPNRIYYSKFNQPEAVPIVNYMEVGSANQPINRIVPLRDGVMVLKQDGVYRISNATPPFTITPIDYNVRILADNTAAELDNKVYFLADQGIVALSDSDVQIRSYILNNIIVENTSPTLFPNLRATAWGVSYQTDFKYILSLPTTSADTQATQQYVFNYITDNWTRWTVPSSCGMIFRKDGKLYLGSEQGTAPDEDNSYIYQERKTSTTSDFADNQYTATNVTTGSTDTIVINNITLPNSDIILPGWTVTQSVNGIISRIVSATVGMTQTTLVLDRVDDWDAGAVILYVPISSEIETIQIDCENPGMNKQFTDMVFMFTEQSFSSLTASISSNTSGSPILDYLVPQSRTGWGISPWGTTPWGGGVNAQGKIRRYVPQKIQRAGWLYIKLLNEEAFTKFGFSGLELFYKNTSSRQK